jgi:predicted permease
MGNPLIAGRVITWADIRERAPVIMVTDNLAREYWDEPAAALGKRMRMPAIEGLQQGPWREIIGVVGNVHDDGLDQDPPTIIYWPLAVSQFWNEELFVPPTMVFALRTTRTADPSLQDEVREAVWSVNSNLPLASVRTLDEILDRSMARTSFTLVMLGIAAGAALLLGAVGIYGVSSYVVSQRSREIGIRMALGAQSRDVRAMVLREGLLLTAAGVVVGIGAAVGLTRLMSALLFGVSAADPVTYATVAAALTAVAMLATWLPARRATRVDPIEALRWK